MRFGPVALDQAEGAILAHSLALPSGRLRKGRVLGAADIAALRAAGLSEVIAARLAPDDLDEDAAAERIGAALAGAGLRATAPFTGRVNLHAEAPGLLEVEAGAVAALNAVDEAITLATLPPLARVAAGAMVATVKIVAYGAPRAAVERAAAAGAGALRLRPVRLRHACLIQTHLPGMKESLLEKGRAAVAGRLAGLGIALQEAPPVPHEAAALARAMAAAEGDLLLVLTASATSDRADVGPAALSLAGGRLERFGMPVDPGNLLYLGAQRGRPVIGLPGCARAPALNGADWVLERVACGLEVSGADIAAMGVGGLLKEIPSRPQPRRGGGRAAPPGRVQAAAVLWPGEWGAPPPPALPEITAALAPCAPGQSPPEGWTALPVRAGAGEGEALAAAIAALPEGAEAALLLPRGARVGAEAFAARMLAAFSPEDGRELVCPEGRRPHMPPVLIGRRFFEAVAALSAGESLASALAEAGDHVVCLSPGRGRDGFPPPEDMR